MIPIIIIGLLKIIIISSDNTRNPIYKCNEKSYLDQQCLTQEKLGDLNFVWLRKCKGSKVCVQLPYYGGMAGVCSTKVRSHYDGESCSKDNKCTSGICDGSKCKGFPENHICVLGLGQCRKGLVCRKDQYKDFYSCLYPIANTQTNCKKFIEGQLDKETRFNPDYNTCQLGYVCSDSVCIPIASVETGNKSYHPLACKSGIIDENNNTCIEYEPNNQTCVENNGTYTCRENGDICLPTSTGAYWCPTSAITDAFKEWYTEWEKYAKPSSKTVLGAYRYTNNKKRANEYFFRYTHFGIISDADECAYDYFWKNNSHFYLKATLFIFSLFFLF